MSSTTVTTVDSIDQAWGEAEAALPEGWIVCGVRAVVNHFAIEGRLSVATWRARALSWDPLVDVNGVGPTKPAALRDLAAKLRDYR